MTEGSRVGSEGEQPGGARLLGTVEVVGPGGVAVEITRPQVQLVLAHLLLERRPIDRGELADLLWGDGPLSPHWQGAVRGVLSKLRDALDEAGIAGTVVAAADGTTRLEVPDGFGCDIVEAEAAVVAAEAALEAAQPGAAVELAVPWVERLQQPLLPAGDGDWVRSAQERVEDLARRALLAEVRGRIADGRADAGAAAAGAWVRRHPLDEGVHHLLIRALVADGRRPEAVAAHDRLAEILVRELGVSPSAATSALVDAPPDPALPLAPPATAVRALRPRAGAQFLGRTDELGVLRRAWAQVVEREVVGAAVVVGASGIGKTRLVQELAAEVAEAGATVCWGRCQPGSGVAFEPLASAVLGALDADRLAMVGEDPRLVADLTAMVEGALPLDEPALARAHRFRTVVRALRTVAASPTLLVVDDLQWASLDVLALLEQVADEIAGPLLIAATGRNLPPAAHEHLARVQRTAGLETVHLEGLDVDDLLPLVGGTADDPRAVATDLHRRTAGHPFFVIEVAGTAGPAGAGIDLAGVPSAVGEWIGHRIDALPKRARARLDLAAVMGAEVVVGPLARAAGADPDDVLDDLERLAEQGFLVETGAVDVFAFPHLITQEAVQARIGPSRQARLHLAAAQALGEGPDELGRHAAIAHHLGGAGDDHRIAASRAGSAAGREALERGAWQLAEELFATAVERAGDDGRARAEALIGLGASLHHQGRAEEAEALVVEAVALARAHRLAEPLADGALALVGRAGRGASRSLDDDAQAQLLREALAGIEALLSGGGARAGDGGEVDRATLVRWETLACRLEGELALALLLTAPAEERARLTRSAVERAHRIDPPDVRLTARSLITARVAKLAPHEIADRLADLDQVLALDPAGRSVETSLTAHTYRHEDLLRLGRRSAARAALDAAEELVGRHPHAYWRWAIATWRGLGHLIDGDLDRAEEQAAVALALQGPEVDGALACFGVNLVDLRLYQGRSGEVLDLLASAADANPHIPCYRAVLALAAAEAGDAAVAERAYEFFAADRFATIPEDTNRLLTLVVLADVAAGLGDADGAPHLRAQLEPFSGQQALLNCFGGGGSYWGPVDHQLARLAVAEGRHDDAARLFVAAEASAVAMEAPLARARIVADPLRVVVA